MTLVAEKLLSFNLAVKERGHLSLAPAGVSLAFHLVEYRNQLKQGGIKPVLEQLKIDRNSVILDFSAALDNF